ncbi:hypothetical protein [Kingella sp. (in: b-proteobacteria)]|uniref:hypothetical protein n=1 Tax=Kingella sp. (in: b-proteobacteria) TaxID=2020713 RepID=UPI0026DD66F8|nr:hypothetical protein [Kingella sp. (in: b-proteobacteria)]
MNTSAYSPTLQVHTLAKQNKCPVGTRRLVKVKQKASHKAPTHFQAALITQGSLKRHLA